ncbi:MAG TPA: glycosyltransferase [bacterium]|nr:glycosyltransferase [bacterium]
MPALTCCIVVYAAGDHVATALAAMLADQSYPHRTILLHNSSPHVSPDELRQLPGDFEVWETSKNLGYAGAINYCLHHTAPTVDLVGIFNDDAAVRPGALGAMVAAFGASDRISAVTASIINAGEPEERRNGTLNLAGRIIPDLIPDRRRVLYPSGAAMLLRRDLPFRCDPDYFLYFEDVYLGLVARSQGYYPAMAPEAKVDHLHHASVATMDPGELAFYRERNRLLLLWTIFGDEALRKLEPYWRQERELRRLTALVGKGNPAAIARAEAWMADNKGLVQIKREAIQYRRAVDDDELIRHFSYRLLPAAVPGATVFNRRARNYCRQHGLWTWDLLAEPGPPAP